MKAERTLKAELRRVTTAKQAAWREVGGGGPAEDWLYGAEVALRWALGHDVASPSHALAWIDGRRIRGEA